MKNATVVILSLNNWTGKLIKNLGQLLKLKIKNFCRTSFNLGILFFHHVQIQAKCFRQGHSRSEAVSSMQPIRGT